ncbi:MAG: hypothetical protein QOH10_1006 [Actinomycetota bacterium]|nr:hypothetical protein [Actinomycetota bacterium]
MKNLILNLWRTRRVQVIIGAAVVVAVVAFALSGGDNKKKTASKPTSTTAKPRPPKPGRRAPLTGVVDKSGKSFTRPAVTVKINNTGAAKQYGIHQADVVYEEVVEGGITRLAAIFNSHAPQRVGPVRSVRKTDQSIVWPIGGVFVYSGGAQYAIDSINTAPVTQLDETRAGALMYRADGTQYLETRDSPWANAPYNLWARVDQMNATAAKPIPPPPLFHYRKAKAKVGGTPVKSFVVGFQGDPGVQGASSFATTWDWNARSGTWLRSKFGGPDIDADNVRLAATNVVVMYVQYDGGVGALQAEAVLTGSGKLSVFTGGKEIDGTWSRPDKAKPAKLLNAKGTEIRLAPGQTWVELPDVSYGVIATP